MKPRYRLSRGAVLSVGLSALVCAAGFAVPRLHPVPTGFDSQRASLQAERDLLAENNDATLANLRQQAKAVPAAGWSKDRFAAEVGTGWRVEWQQPDGRSRPVLLSRSEPRLSDWPEYLRVIRKWAGESGIAVQSLDVVAGGGGQGRVLRQVVIGLRIVAGEDAMDERIAGPGPPLPVQSQTPARAAADSSPSTRNPANP